jgi:hypothetical protein
LQGGPQGHSIVCQKRKTTNYVTNVWGTNQDMWDSGNEDEHVVLNNNKRKATEQSSDVGSLSLETSSEVNDHFLIKTLHSLPFFGFIMILLLSLEDHKEIDLYPRD